MSPGHGQAAATHLHAMRVRIGRNHRGRQSISLQDGLGTYFQTSG